MTNLALPNTSRITNAFDTVGRLASTRLLASGSSLLDSQAYLYNQASQRTQQTRTDASTVTYTYDNIGQLKSAIGSGGQSTENLGYLYDIAGAQPKPGLSDGPRSPLFAPVPLVGNAELTELASTDLSSMLREEVKSAPQGDCVCWGIPYRIERVALARREHVTLRRPEVRLPWLVFMHTTDVAWLPRNAQGFYTASPGTTRLREHVADYVMRFTDGSEARVPGRPLHPRKPPARPKDVECFCSNARLGVDNPNRRSPQHFVQTMSTLKNNPPGIACVVDAPACAEDEAPIHYTDAEKIERRALGLPPCESAPPGILRKLPKGRTPLSKKAISAPSVLNEASLYGSAFARGLRVDLPGGVTQLLISGTASVGENGETLYPGDFRAQLWRTYHNITKLLESEGATWHDVVRTTCYIRDIERDYAEFNAVRNEFFCALGLDPFPASTGIQARICRSDLLVEIEALAILVREGAK